MAVQSLPLELNVVVVIVIVIGGLPMGALEGQIGKITAVVGDSTES